MRSVGLQFPNISGTSINIINALIVNISVNLKLRYSLEMRTLTVEPGNDGSTLKVPIPMCTLNIEVVIFRHN